MAAAGSIGTGAVVLALVVGAVALDAVWVLFFIQSGVRSNACAVPTVRIPAATRDTLRVLNFMVTLLLEDRLRKIPPDP